MPRLTVSHPSLARALAVSVGTSALLTCTVLGLLQIPALIGAIRDLVPEAEARTASGGHGHDPWRLRPSDIGTTGSIHPPEARVTSGVEIPDERRMVRVVYPGLTAQR
jgi:hypothetical protein